MTDEELERMIYVAMIELGWLIPRTIEEVEIVERAMEGEPEVELPEELRRVPEAE